MAFVSEKPNESLSVRFFRKMSYYFDTIPVFRRKPFRNLRLHLLDKIRGTKFKPLGNLTLELDLDRGNQRKIFWASSEYEPALQLIIKNYLPDAGYMIDCGANAGLFGFKALQKPHTKVIFVEPHPRLAAQLRRNIDRNGLNDRAKVIEAAASDQDGVSTLIEAISDQDGSHSLVQNKYSDPNGARISVKTKRLDSVLPADIERISLLKIDAEFFDYQVLVGLGQVIEKVDMIYIEMSHEQFDGCFDYLTDNGFIPHGSLSYRKIAKSNGRFLEPFSRGKHTRDLLWTRQSTI